MMSLKKLTHNQIRYLLLPPLALVLVHLVAYKKLPFEEGYQFPLINFISVLFIAAICCEVNTFSYLKLSRKVSLKEEPKIAIFRQIVRSLVLTTALFTIVVYSINYFVFGAVNSFSSFLSSLFVALLIVTVETLVYIVRDLRIAQNNAEVLKDTVVQSWLINSGNKSVNISVEDISYIYSQSGLVYVVGQSGEKHLTQFNSINELSEKYNTDMFFRLNRQYLIKPSAVKEIQKEVNQKLKVLLTPVVSQLPQEAMVSRYTSPEFKKWMRK